MPALGAGTIHVSQSLISEKEYAAAVIKTSMHIKMWEEKLKWVRSWQFVKPDNRKIIHACKKGWILNLNCVIQLWEFLKEQQSFFLTNCLNQNCLENSFSSIPRIGSFRDNPDCKQFESVPQFIKIKQPIKL